MLKDDVLPVVPLVVDVVVAAKMLGVCPRTVRNLTKRGELPVVRIASRVLYRVEDLTNFVQQRAQRESSGNSTLNLE